MPEIPLFDGHCDAIWRCRRDGVPLLHNRDHVDLIRGGAYQPWAQFFAVFFEPEEVPSGDLYGEYRACVRWLQRELEGYSGGAVQCRTAAEILAAGASGRAAAVLSVEGAELLDCSIEKLEAAYEDGVRAVNLTWNHANRLSGSIKEEPVRGLSGEGRGFVRRMQELGMLVDVSHLSEPGFWGVMEEARLPVVASHSNARAVWNHPRNLTDAQFLAIVQTGGTAGINLYADFLGREPTVDTAVEHIEHFLSLGGEGHVSLGCDLDGCDRLPRGFRGIEDMEKLYNALLRRNYSEELARDIFYNNLMRVVEKVCGI